METFGSRLAKVVKDYIGYIVICIFIIAGTVAKDISTKYFQNKEWSFNSLNKDASRNAEISKLLSQIREITAADNATIFLFHNGGFFSSGVPYRKMSPMYSSDSVFVKKGYTYDNIPLSYVPNLIAKLSQEDGCFFIKTNDIDDSPWKSMLLSNNYFSNVYKRLQLGEKMIGYIKISWANKEEHDLNKEALKKIENSSEVLSFLLSENSIE